MRKYCTTFTIFSNKITKICITQKAFKFNPLFVKYLKNSSYLHENVHIKIKIK